MKKYAVAIFVPIVAAILATTAFADLDEEIRFGKGLSAKKYPHLAIEVLEPIVDELKTDAQKRDAYSALETAHQDMAKSAQMEKAEREAHSAKASKYGGLLTKLVLAVPEDRDGLSAMIGTLVQQHQQAQAESNDELRNQRFGQIFTTMEAVIANLKKISDPIIPKIKEHEEKEPEEYEGPKREAWDKKYNEIRQPYMLAVIEANRGRFYYYKMLPAEEKKKRDELLQIVIKELDEIIGTYDTWGPTILAYHIHASACIENKEYDKASSSAEGGIELIKALFESAPAAVRAKLQQDLAPWHGKLISTWIFASAKSGRFEDVIEKLKPSNDPEVNFVIKPNNDPEIFSGLLEFWLIKEQYHLEKKEEEPAAASGKEADKYKAQLLAMGDMWRMKSDELTERYRGGTSKLGKILKELDQARKRNDVNKIIFGALEAIATGELKAEKRTQLTELLAYIYWQDRRYLESYVTYRHLATTEKDEAKATKYSTFAVLSIQKMSEASRSMSDRLVLDAAKDWQRANFDVPGKEYDDAIKAKNGKRYKEAIDLFKKVPPDSIFGETAMQQIGECYINLAREEVNRKKPEEAWQLAEQGRLALTDVLKKVNEKSQIPRVVARRKQLRSAIIHRLAVTDLWEGHEDYKLCLTRTEGFLEEYPDLPLYIKSHVTMLRIRSLVALDQPDQAADELARIEEPTDETPDVKNIRKLVKYAKGLVFSGFSKQAENFDQQVQDKTAAAEKSANPQEKERLLKEIEELRIKGNNAGDKALPIISAMIDEDPNQPFDLYWFLICELDRKQRHNEVLPQIQAFLEKYGKDPKLTKKQKENVVLARTMLGISQYHSGQFKEAYDTLTKEMEGDKEEGGTPYYWQKKIYIAKALKGMVEQDPNMAGEAVKQFIELRKKIKEGTEDWWDVSVSLLEIRNTLGQYGDNVFTIKMMMGTQKDLFNSAIRQRYIRVLASAKEKALQDEQQKLAASLLADVLMIEVECNVKEEKYYQLIQTFKQFEMYLPEYGGDENKAKLKAMMEQVVPKTEGEVKTDAEAILRNLSR